MATIDVECPKCGAPGSVPRDRAHTRLVCKKCHAVFHLTAVGRPVLGEPTAGDAKHDDHHSPGATADEAEGGTSLSRAARIGGLVVVLVAIALGYGAVTIYSRTRPAGQSVAPRAKAVADAIAHESLDALRIGSLSGTDAHTSRFLEMARQALAPIRAASPSKEVEANIQILELTEDQTRAQVVGHFTAKKGSSREQRIAEAEAAVTNQGAGAGLGAKPGTTDLMLWFSKDERGDWRFDPARSAVPRPGA